MFTSVLTVLILVVGVLVVVRRKDVQEVCSEYYDKLRKRCGKKAVFTLTPLPNEGILSLEAMREVRQLQEMRGHQKMGMFQAFKEGQTMAAAESWRTLHQMRSDPNSTTVSTTTTTTTTTFTASTPTIIATPTTMVVVIGKARRTATLQHTLRYP